MLGPWGWARSSWSGPGFFRAVWLVRWASSVRRAGGRCQVRWDDGVGRPGGSLPKRRASAGGWYGTSHPRPAATLVPVARTPPDAAKAAQQRLRDRLAEQERLVAAFYQHAAHIAELDAQLVAARAARDGAVAALVGSDLPTVEVVALTGLSDKQVRDAVQRSGAGRRRASPTPAGEMPPRRGPGLDRTGSEQAQAPVAN